jgi:hypothetical protein
LTNIHQPGMFFLEWDWWLQNLEIYSRHGIDGFWHYTAELYEFRNWTRTLGLELDSNVEPVKKNSLHTSTEQTPGIFSFTSTGIDVFSVVELFFSCCGIVFLLWNCFFLLWNCFFCCGIDDYIYTSGMELRNAEPGICSWHGIDEYLRNPPV